MKKMLHRGWLYVASIALALLGLVGTSYTASAQKLVVLGKSIRDPMNQDASGNQSGHDLDNEENWNGSWSWDHSTKTLLIDNIDSNKPIQGIYAKNIPDFTIKVVGRCQFLNSAKNKSVVESEGNSINIVGEGEDSKLSLKTKRGGSHGIRIDQNRDLTVSNCLVDVESENIGITGAGNGRGVGILLKDGGMIEAKGKSGAITDIKDYIKVYENGGVVKINQSVTYAQVTSFDEKVEYKNGNIVYARNGNIVEDEWVMLAPYYPIEVGGIRLHKYRVYLSSDNYPSIIKSGAVIYNAKEHTLTLAGATIQTPNRPMVYDGIFSNHPSKYLTIKCKGINTITAEKKSGIYIEDIESPVIMGEGWNSSLEIYPSTSPFFPGVGILDYSKSSVDDHMLIKNIDLKISGIFSCISTGTQNKKVILRNLNATLSTSSSRLIEGFETLAIENAYIASPLGAVVEGGTIKLNGEPLAGTTCEIKKGDLPSYPITIDPNIEHGKVTLSHSGSVAYGTEVTVMVTPNEGYKLAKLTANGVDITATKTFVVKAATTVEATFALQAFAVTAKAPQNGKITIKGYGDLTKVPYGTELTVEVTPNQGYELTKLTANGADITATKTFVVKKATTVEATFTKQTFAVTAKAPQNGKITIKGYSDLKKVPYGTELTVEVTPNAGYKLAKLTANGADITATKKFVVKKATTVEATFTKDTAIEEVATTEAILYPNPAEDAATLSGVEAGAVVQVFLLDGVEVLRTVADEAGVARLNLTGVAAGKYLVKSGETTVVLLVTK